MLFIIGMMSDNRQNKKALIFIDLIVNKNKCFWQYAISNLFFLNS